MLNKQSQNILWAIGLAILAIVILELVRPQPLNWRPSYTSDDKIPLGCFILFQELPDLLNTPVETTEKDPYEFFLEKSSETNTAYFFINENFNFDANQVSAIKDYVANGNTMFVSALQFGFVFKDSLNVATHLSRDLLETTITPRFYNPQLNSGNSSKFRKRVYKSSFDSVDTLNTEALGYFEADEVDDEPLVNLIRLKHGKGQFILHTLPQAFTNYYLLKGDPTYAATVLSFIDAEKIYWDSYLKYGKKVVSSPIQFVLSNPPLKWAYYLTILGILFFILFVAKREQRVIEVISPLENTSVEFAKTIGNLYLQHGDFTDIITKKINYFMAHVRLHYSLNTDTLDDDFIHRLAQKSGHSEEQTTSLIRYIKYQKSKLVHTDMDLLELNKQMEAFTQ